MNISIDPPQGRAHVPPPDISNASIDLEALDESGEKDQICPGSSDIHPIHLAQNRIEYWPDVEPTISSCPILDIYTAVKSWGLPNMLGPRIPVPSPLKFQAWKDIATGHIHDSFILDGVRYGFPIQYTGPPIYRDNKSAHASAYEHMEHVRKYVRTETANQAMIGPYTRSPFRQWINVSPVMTRPKAEQGKRRIIVDLSYPLNNNVNSFVQKNTIFAVRHDHRLPRVHDTVRAIQAHDYQVLLATIDVERAYRNVPTCPLDLPLLAIKVDDCYYVDTAMPFGSRNSSLYMQMLANYVVRALGRMGIVCQMYLDDMVLQLDKHQDCHARFMEVLRLYRALGLPIAFNKIQAPAPCVTYLGINIDVPSATLTIPQSKIDRFMELVKWVLGQTQIPKTIAQRLVGKINHLSACVDPARMFMGRILYQLRQAHDQHTIQVAPMRPDLHWFIVFLTKYNGRSFMKPPNPTKVICADSCLTGGGATDMVRCYTLEYSRAIADSHHISTLEALNCLVACRTLLSSKDKHTTVELKCDNNATIEAMAHGRARDPVLAAICRAMWYYLARLDIRMVFTHVPGIHMGLADALSRAHIDQQHKHRADKLIRELRLIQVKTNKFATNYKNFL